MSDFVARTKEGQIAFAITPPRDGALSIYFAIPEGAWERMKNWRSIEFNLVPHGVPLQMMITRCRDRAEGLHHMHQRGLKFEPSPEARKDWILLGVGEGYGALVLVLIIPDAAKRGMANRRMKYTLDLRKSGVAPLRVGLIARPTHAACMATLHEMIADSPVHDLTGQDVSFDDDPSTRP
jgi:hypothetical protein